MLPPTLQTERLVLRPHRPSDLDQAAALWAHPDVTRFISGRPFSREEVWARLLRYAGHWLWLDYGFWAIEERATGLFAGELGFANFEREIDPPIANPESGWVLHPDFHNRGYALEALTAAHQWAAPRFPATTCLIHPDNAPSLRLAHKLGYHDSYATVYKGQPSIVLHRP